MKGLKRAYPVLMKRTDDGYYVEIPDMDTATQGNNIAEAIEMARDAIGLMGIDYQGDGETIPEPYSVEFSADGFDISTLVDIDFLEYRKKLENKAVKKNCTIPYWLNEQAEKEGINFSRLLQEALATKLGVSLR